MLRPIYDVYEFIKATGKTVGDTITIKSINDHQGEKICLYLITGFNYGKGIIDLGITAVSAKGLAEHYVYKDDDGEWAKFMISVNETAFMPESRYKVSPVVKGEEPAIDTVFVQDIVWYQDTACAIVSFQSAMSKMIIVIRKKPVYHDAEQGDFIQLDEDHLVWAKDLVKPKKISVI